MPVLVVNIDHVATLRQARLGIEPEPVTGAHLAELGGAHGVIVHLREDRRHIQDRDVELLSRCLNTRLHLEMAATMEMQSIALKVKPYIVCLVPEKREELTTEGGLAVAGHEDALREFLVPIHAQGIKSSLFVDAQREQLEASASVGAEYVEIHTGHYASATTEAERLAELDKIIKGVAMAQELGLKVNLGHGLNYTNIRPFAKVPGIREYSIGHSIMSRAIFVGLEKAVRQMADLVDGFVD